MTLTFDIPQETVDLLCRMLGYTPTINVPTGQTDTNGSPVYVEKPISQDDFLYNWYSQLMDGNAVTQKQIEAQKAALDQVGLVSLSLLQTPKAPILTDQGITAAVSAANQKIADSNDPLKP